MTTPDGNITAEVNAKLNLTDRMIRVLVETVETLRELGASTDDIVRCLRFTIDEMTQGDDEADE